MTVKVFYNNGDIRTLGDIKEVRTSEDNLILLYITGDIVTIPLSDFDKFRCFI